MDQEKLKSLLTYHPEDGVFIWNKRGYTGKAKKGWDKRFAGKVAGNYDAKANKHYINILGKNYTTKYLACLYMGLDINTKLISYKDGNANNDRWDNIIIITEEERLLRLREKRNKLVYGTGVNDSPSSVRHCPYYNRWSGMLARCYNSTETINPTYMDCTVCEDWLTFSSFKSWMEVQDWEGKELDKDILVEGNKVYSPDTCLFVHKKVNSFFNSNQNCRGSLLLGVSINPWDSTTFDATCCNSMTEKGGRFVGTYNTETEAHFAWKQRKHELACILAESVYVTDKRVAEALKTRYENYNLIEGGKS